MGTTFMRMVGALIFTISFVTAFGCSDRPDNKEIMAAVKESPKYVVKDQNFLRVPWSKCSTPGGLPSECTQLVQPDNYSIIGVVCGVDGVCGVAVRGCIANGTDTWDCTNVYDNGCFTDQNAKDLVGNNPCVDAKCKMIFSSANGTQNKSVGMLNAPPRAKGAPGYPSPVVKGTGDCQCTAELCNLVTGAYDPKATCTEKSAGTEACGGGDEDCDGATDEKDASSCAKFYTDGDGDTFGSTSNQCLCKADTQFTVKATGDCDDADKLINPSAKEACDGKDNDCDGTKDNENASGCNKFFEDADADTFGTDANKCLCAAGGVFTASQNMDCNDKDKAINPKAAETCATVGVDDNCNGATDEENAATCKTFYTDADADTFGTTVNKCLCSAAAPLSATVTGECDDADKLINPSAKETCDGKDNDCDGLIDEVDAVGCTKFYTDEDADGFGTGSAQCLCKKTGSVTATKGGDCNDKDKTVNPSAVEVCGGGDENCDGSVDEGAVCNACATALIMEVDDKAITQSSAMKIKVDTSAASDKAKAVLSWTCASSTYVFSKAVGAEFAVRPKAAVGKMITVLWVPDKSKTPIGSYAMFTSSVNSCGADVDSDGDGIKESVSAKVCGVNALHKLTLDGTGAADTQITLDGRATSTGLNPTGMLVGELWFWQELK